jgi:type III secretory pathway component EscV
MSKKTHPIVIGIGWVFYTAAFTVAIQFFLMEFLGLSKGWPVFIFSLIVAAIGMTWFVQREIKKESKQDNEISDEHKRIIAQQIKADELRKREAAEAEMHRKNKEISEIKEYERLALEKAEKLRQEAEAQERERLRREQEEADERAFWNSPEGRRLRAERELAEIRRKEREEAAEMAKRMAEEEHRRQQEALKNLKDL